MCRLIDTGLTIMILESKIGVKNKEEPKRIGMQTVRVGVELKSRMFMLCLIIS